MTGWPTIYVLVAMLFLNILIAFIFLVLAPYHLARLVHGASRRLRRSTQRFRLRRGPGDDAAAMG